MQKNELTTSHFKVRSACRDLIEAVNDNPHVFDGLEYKEPTISHERQYGKARIGQLGILAVLGIWLMRTFH